MDFILQQLRKPHGVLMPWLALVVLLAGVLWAVRTVGIDGAEQSRAKLELEWNQARQELTHHKEAQNARKDLAQVWSVLPVERDFAPLALGITEEAKRDRVILPALSYKTEPTPVANTSKGVLEGTMTGRTRICDGFSMTWRRPRNWYTSRTWNLCTQMLSRTRR